MSENTVRFIRQVSGSFTPYGSEFGPPGENNRSIQIATNTEVIPRKAYFINVRSFVLLFFPFWIIPQKKEECKG